MPVAAIESLVSLLAATPTSTISETLDLLATNVQTLKAAIPNAISLSAGTDLFQRYLITALQRSPGSSAPPASSDFKAIRQHLLSNGRLFVARAKEARMAIAGIARRFIGYDSTVLTIGGSRAVGATLKAAAEAQRRESGAPRFRVIYVVSPFPLVPQAEGYSVINELRKLGVPVAVIPESAVAYSMGKVSMVVTGAEGVVENGGVISRLGTYQMSILAKSMGKPVYVVAETHKFVRMFPLGQYDIGVEQSILDFTTDDVEGAATEENDKGELQAGWTDKTPTVEEKGEYFGSVLSPGIKTSGKGMGLNSGKTVDYTPPDLITALITEAGVHTPSAVSEELIKIWY
jgi:translation initiation factor eIF-2B subunit alpha